MGILIMIVAMTLAGSSIAVTKKLTGTMPVFLANELSLLIAWIALIPVGAHHLFKQKKKPDSSWIRASAYPALQALFGMALFRVFTFWGLRYVSAIEGGLMTAAAPSIMVVLAFFLLKESPNSRRIGAVVLAGAGVAVLNWKSGAFTGSLLGTALILLATACESFLTIFRKMEKKHASPMVNTFYIVSFSLLFLLPATVIEGEWHRLPHLTAEQLLGCIYLGLVPTVLGYFCWGYASCRIDAGITGIITSMMPLSAALISILWLGETPTRRHLIGGICIVFSILVSVVPMRLGSQSRR